MKLLKSGDFGIVIDNTRPSYLTIKRKPESHHSKTEGTNLAVINFDITFDSKTPIVTAQFDLHETLKQLDGCPKMPVHEGVTPENVCDKLAAELFHIISFAKGPIPEGFVPDVVKSSQPEKPKP